MNSLNWGLLGPETLASERRTRTLGLGTVVRTFNDLAVPGMGGVKYCKSVFLACLGVYVAEKARITNPKLSSIQVTNAIEALACYLSYQENGWQSDPRLQGNTKLKGKEDLSFKAVSKSNFYVTQPTRMATVQTLPGLGLVDAKGERFNSYCLSVHGKNLVEDGCKGFKYQRNPITVLTEWVKDNSNPKNLDGLRKAISPLVELAKGAKGILKERLVSGNDENATRRRNALNWVSKLKEVKQHSYADWKKPTELSIEHFNDIQTGACFFMLRDKVMQLLDVIETEVENSSLGRLYLNEEFSTSIHNALSNIKRAAKDFINIGHDRSPNKLATAFANECIQEDIVRIVERDSVVLKIRDKAIVKGPAFGGVQAELKEEYPEESIFPAGVSYRLWNLYVLNLDFEGKLDTWLNKKDAI